MTYYLKPNADIEGFEANIWAYAVLINALDVLRSTAAPVPAIPLAADARAALPAMPAWQPGEQRFTVKGPTPRAAIAVLLPGVDTYDITRARRANLLGRVLGERVQDRLRTELGAAYSPHAWHSAGGAYRDDGFFGVVVSVAPEQADAALGHILGLLSDLRTQGVGADVFERASIPLRKGIPNQLKQNGWWLNTLIRAADQPFRLEWPKTLQSDYDAITAADLSALAAELFDPERAVRIVGICPGPAKPAP